MLLFSVTVDISHFPELSMNAYIVNSQLVEVHLKLLISQSKFSGDQKIYFEISVV